MMGSNLAEAKDSDSSRTGEGPGPVATWVLSYPPARTWICNNDLLRLAVTCR